MVFSPEAEESVSFIVKSERDKACSSALRYPTEIRFATQLKLGLQIVTDIASFFFIFSF